MEQLLTLLADGNIHSGEQLGAALGISRAGIWKQLQQLSSHGVKITSVKGKGYAIEGGVELLESSRITSLLSENAMRNLNTVEVRFSVDSTNRAVQKLPVKSVVVAEMQTQGSGRRGRQWVSPLCGNIYYSMTWRFEQGATAVEGLSLAVGVCVKRAVESVVPVEVGLKWPNDIYLGDKKLGGILLEIIGDPTGECEVVIGVGINCTLPEHIAQEISQPWTTLDSVWQRPISRNALVAALANHLTDMLEGYEQQKFASWRAAWAAADIYRDRSVAIILPTRKVYGVAKGVAESGALRLEINGSIEEFNGGEVSLRSES